MELHLKPCITCSGVKELSLFESLPSGNTRGSCKECYNSRRRDLQGGAEREKEKREKKLIAVINSLGDCRILRRYKAKNGGYSLSLMYKGFKWEVRQSSFLNGVFPWSQARQGHLNGLSCVYKFEDASGTVLYIGKSKRLPYRLSQHFSPSEIGKSEQKWKNKVAKVSYIILNNRSDMHIAEMYLIAKLNPLYNKDSSDRDGTTFHLELPSFKEIWVSFVYDR